MAAVTKKSRRTFTQHAGTGRRFRSRGFTVLEVLIATGLLSIGFSAVFALLTAANNSHRNSVDRTHAATLAASVFEDMANRYWTHYQDADGDGNPDALADPMAASRAGYPSLGSYTYTVRVVPSTYIPRPEANSGLREIFVTVSVSWRNRSEAYSQSYHRLIFIKPPFRL